jgi:electron transfer flavoprotein alpha subunit
MVRGFAAIARTGLVGNLFEILPALTAALEEAKPHAV